MKTLRTAVSFAMILTALAAVGEPNSQQSFNLLKSFSGAWEGKNAQGMPVAVSYRVTAGGSALMSEIVPSSEMKGHDNMISMFHMDNDRLLLTHYCSSGNQPRMVASASPDGKSVTFDFLDATNLATPKTGHMNRVIFTVVDANHHTEDWRFVQDGKEITELFDLYRKN
jgi:hypothetical protein